MTKTIILSICFLWTVYASAQTCGNPEARLKRLKSPTVTIDTLSKWVKNDLELIKLQAGDTIADIGSYDGYYPTLYSIFNDSVTFYLNDIREFGFAYLDSIRTNCEKISGQKISNEFIVSIGNDTSTNLPADLFDKVIIRDALHHFKSIDKMLVDVKRIIKPEAELILFEPIREQAPKNDICSGAMTETVLLNLLTEYGFTLMEKRKSRNSFSWFKFVLAEK